MRLQPFMEKTMTNAMAKTIEAKRANNETLRKETKMEEKLPDGVIDYDYIKAEARAAHAQKSHYDQQRREEADRFIPQLEEIITEFTGFPGRTATRDEDMNENFDYLDCWGDRWMLRTMSFKCLSYRSDIMLRHNRNSNNLTEWQKFLQGMGDFMIYSYKDKSGLNLHSYRILDLRMLRKVMLKFPHYATYRDCGGDVTGMSIRIDGLPFPGEHDIMECLTKKAPVELKRHVFVEDTYQF